MVSAGQAWTSVEVKVHRELKSLSVGSGTESFTGRTWLVMCSGGADSMALLRVLQALQPALQIDLEVLHCHHGPADNPGQNEYRDRAQVFVQETCESLGIAFHAARSLQTLKSEEQLRDFRLAKAGEFLQSGRFQFVVWGHQAQDYLETRMLRLIRGSGVFGLEEPMSLLRDRNLRPLLSLTRSEILVELQERGAEWIEDPSNKDESYLRNWLRHNWLPQLETKCPGALRSLSRSLDLIFESQNESWPEGLWVGGGLSRSVFLTLSEAQKKQVLALYLRKTGQMKFTHNQIKEILRNLDISKNEHTFRAASARWTLTKDLISAKFQ